MTPTIQGLDPSIHRGHFMRMHIQDTKILLIGAGKMGGALLGAWLGAGIGKSIAVVEPRASATPLGGAKIFQKLDEIDFEPDCIVLAVKPQSMDEVLSGLKKKFSSKPLYLSIAAGKTISYYEEHLGKDTAMVRAMPNLPFVIGCGVSALIANDKVKKIQKDIAASLLRTKVQENTNAVLWLENESQMHAVTAISGSGPAYMFLLMEALTTAGVACGLDDKSARVLAAETTYGAGALARVADESLEQLRKNVTSPGGTTEAALKVLMKEDALQSLVSDAVAEAVKRSKELA